MATRAISDLAVKVGSYTDRNGEQKNRYVNVGKIFQKDDGSKFIAINRTFNPAGVPNPDHKEMLVLSTFEIRDRDDAGQRTQSPAPAPAPKPASNGGASGFDDMDSDIPF